MIHLCERGIPHTLHGYSLIIWLPRSRWNDAEGMGKLSKNHNKNKDRAVCNI